MSNWLVSDLETRLYGIIKKPIEKKYKPIYKDLYITNTNRLPVNTKPKFPTVYIQLLGGSEVGSTLDYSGVNGINCTVQVEVTTADDKEATSDIMADIVDILVSKFFRVTTTPFFQNTNDTYRKVARFSRVIGASDVLKSD